MNKDTTSSSFTVGLIVGAVVGLAIGFLYAPQSGKETRRMVKEKASAIKEKASKAVSKIKGSADSLRKMES